jgi:hypothetical protein
MREETSDVPGSSSNQPTTGSGDTGTSPEIRDPRRVRVTNLYATPLHLADDATGRDLPDYLKLWRFEPFYRLSASQLPRVLLREELDTSLLRFQRWQLAGRITGARIWLFRLPSGQIVTAFSLDAHCELIDTISLLEDCYFCDVHIGEETVEEYVHAMATQLCADGGPDHSFLPERHQIVFDQVPAPNDCEDLVQRLIYRTDLPYRKEYSAIRYPRELNRRPGWLAAVGPYVSVVCGHPDFIENSIFLSAAQGVAASAQLRAIRHAAYADVQLFRSLEAAPGTTQARRRTLERIADQLGDLELELSYSVEATADLGLLVPSLRAESFHDALYDSMDLADKATTAGRMLSRLGAAIRAELTAIESIERRTDDNRRVRYAVAVGFVSAVAIPTSLILAFLGINASQVSGNLSMFSHHYLGMYLTVAAVVAMGAIVSLSLYARQRHEARDHRTPAQRSRWILAPKKPFDADN